MHTPIVPRKTHCADAHLFGLESAHMVGFELLPADAAFFVSLLRQEIKDI